MIKYYMNPSIPCFVDTNSVSTIYWWCWIMSCTYTVYRVHNVLDYLNFILYINIWNYFRSVNNGHTLLYIMMELQVIHIIDIFHAYIERNTNVHFNYLFIWSEMANLFMCWNCFGELTSNGKNVSDAHNARPPNVG